MITVKELSKSYGNQILFDEASFVIVPGEKIGLIGRNGHGKSTFLRMLIGEEEPDSGAIEIAKNYTIAHVSQHLRFDKESLIEEACVHLDNEDEKWQAEKILMGLGFSEEDFTKSPLQFSGGYQVRINLAKTLLQNPNLLLLDEPTNYLDITSIRWLIDFLKKWEGELILITHDRSVMDSVITHTVAIHRSRIRKIEGNTEKMYQQIAKEEEIHEKTRINDQKKRAEIENYINRFRAKARIASRVKSRQKLLDKFEEKEKLAQIQDLDFLFNESPLQAKTLISVEDLQFGYDERPLIKDLTITVGRSDRICIIGRNGKGKTTLLKLLAGKLEAQKGNLTYHPQLEMGYFEQTNISTLDPKRSVNEEIAAGLTDEEAQRSRSIAGAMMFSGDDALKPISVLSGGEKARVMLGKIIIQKSNLLLLDEPTNHLDMQSCDSLIEALDNFGGGIIMVTHNEMFLHALANRLIVFYNNGIMVHEGDYDSFLKKYGRENEENQRVTEAVAETAKSVNKKELRKLKAQIQNERTAVTGPLKKSIDEHESSIESLEESYAALQEELLQASQSGEGKAIQELSIKSHEMKAQIDTLYNELESAMTSLEEHEAEFEGRLAELQ